MKNNHYFKIEAPESDYLYTRESQIQLAGQGLFTAILIHRNEIISVFKGEVLSAREAKLRAEKGENRYFIQLLNGKIMDSANTPCFAKYANDAGNETGFKNNAEITLDDRNRVCLVAKRTIKPGEEIFCSYGSSYWKGLTADQKK